jgi:glycosyltransferase involved in cell wall biosynthesis
MQPVIYADLRCLQDQDFQGRGIGYHTAALLRARRHSRLADSKLVGLIDPRMAKLPSQFMEVVDEVTSSANPWLNGPPVVFIDGSPMTHDPRFSIRFQNHPNVLRAAVLYDFIPLDRPGYLPTPAARIAYLARLARLKTFDLFFPISEYTAWRASELLGVPSSRFHVTGACVRRSLYEIRNRLDTVPSPYDQSEPYFVTLGGDDRRKNTGIVVKALRHLNLIYGRRIPLKVIGFYSLGYALELLDATSYTGYKGGVCFLEFYPNTHEEKIFYSADGSGPADRWKRPSISDEEVVSLHAGAIAAIAPSHIEGFSLPIVEASVCGCPVIASTCAAHLELVEQPEALFDPYDVAGLSEKLEALLHNPTLRASLAVSQSHLGPEFHEEAVGRRFWSALEAAVNKPRTVAIGARPKKPRLAFLSPYPPDQSSVAVFTAMTMRAGAKLFDSDLYTDAVRPLTFEGTFRDAGTVSMAPLVNGQYQGVISMLGNSGYHTRIFEVFERYGGPCILHDTLLTQLYFQRLGQEGFQKLADGILGRPARAEEVNGLLYDANPPPLFLEPVIERASPLIVHTVTQQAHLKKRFGARAQVAPCCPTILFRDAELTVSARQAVREGLGIDPATFLISSFGSVDRANGMDSCILAIDLLRSWNIPAELYFVGEPGDAKAEVDRISTMYGIAQYIHYGPEFAGDATYRDFLIASDAAVQLRSYAFGQLSTALLNCISAGLPSVATADMAESCEAPAYISTVPDRFSPLQVAEQLALIWEAQAGRGPYADARTAYLATHNFECYGKRLMEILSLA